MLKKKNEHSFFAKFANKLTQHGATSKKYRQT